ncbi:spore germination protein [Bacillus marasmi]|uniref:spore germination protein n=1 Tax=Bacillus marasmi TaxID=1926279 RepID=UPI0011C957E9|nr:spore germination protein [Bacillus marasmi]
MFTWLKKSARHLFRRAIHVESNTNSNTNSNTDNLINQRNGFNQSDSSLTTNNNRANNHFHNYKKVNRTLNENRKFLETTLGNNSGIINRSFQVGENAYSSGLLFAVSGMVETTVINENVLGPLMKMAEPPANLHKSLLVYLKESVLSVAEIDLIDNLHQIVNELFTGKIVLFVEGEETALIINAQAWEMRGIEQPITETVIRGPRDSFTEDISTNLTLLRRRIRNPNLRCESLLLGKQSNTKVVIAYIDGIVNKEVLKEVYTRLENIKVDAILESGYIEQYIEDAPFSIFPTVGNQEKPDIVAAQLLEGRVSIFVDGTPIVLTVPYLLINHFQVSEDYFSRPYYSNFVRILRVISFFISVLLPGVFVAIQYFHPILIPFSLLVKFFITRANVPFQLYVEMILMLIIFEIIRESGLRMPKPVGQAVSLVGALILGEAAVSAGLVGIPVVVTVALVGISSFPVNSLSEPISLLRIAFVVAGATFGLFGILMLGMIVVSHLASLRSFGVPFTAPLFPIKISDWIDGIIRIPLWLMTNRPATIGSANRTKQKFGGLSGEGKRGKE